MKISKLFDHFFGFVLGPIVGFFRGLWGELAQPPKLLYLGNLILASFAAVAGLICGIVTGPRWGLFGQFEHGFFRSSPQEGGG